MVFDESLSLDASSDLQNQGGFVFDEGLGLRSETGMSDKPPEPRLENGITIGLGGIY
jgi:hypothetical protein